MVGRASDLYVQKNMCLISGRRNGGDLLLLYLIIDRVDELKQFLGVPEPPL